MAAASRPVVARRASPHRPLRQRSTRLPLQCPLQCRRVQSLRRRCATSTSRSRTVQCHVLSHNYAPNYPLHTMTDTTVETTCWYISPVPSKGGATNLKVGGTICERSEQKNFFCTPTFCIVGGTVGCELLTEYPLSLIHI